MSGAPPPAFEDLLERISAAHIALKGEIDALYFFVAPPAEGIPAQLPSPLRDLTLPSLCADAPRVSESPSTIGFADKQQERLDNSPAEKRMSRVTVPDISLEAKQLAPLEMRTSFNFDRKPSLGRLRGGHHRNSFSDIETLVSEQDGVQAWNPDSFSRTLFDMVALLMLAYDAFVVPYCLAWDEKEVDWLLAFVWITRIFWTIDLPLNLVTGYRTGQFKLELRLKPSALHYIRTTFLADGALVVVDWVGGLSSDSSLRPFRLLKLLRGARQVVRAAGLLQKAKLIMPSKEAHMCMDIAMVLLMMVWVNHMVCCAWYFIGKLEGNGRRTWLTELPENNEGVTRAYEYWTSLHWAFTQMTPASMEVMPRCSLERAFSVGIIFVGLVLGSSLIATITSIMTQYRLALEDSAKKFLQLQTFLTQQGLEPRIAMAIRLQVLARLREKQRLKMADVHHLLLTSRSTRDMLKYHSGIMQLGRHPFLATLDVFDKAGMQSVISRSASTHQFTKNDLVFEVSSSSDRMIFASNGQFLYSPGNHSPEMTSIILAGKPEPFLNPGEWCSEAALWTFWTHLGSLEAVMTSEALYLSGPDLQSELVRHPEIRFIVAEYCQAFQAFMSQPGAQRTDLIPSVDTQEIMSALPHETRLTLAAPLLEQLRSKHSVFHRKKFDNLEEELRLGKCHICHVGGELMRAVFVVAVRLHKPQPGIPLEQARIPSIMSQRALEDTKFLVKIADVPRGTGHPIKPSCNMPGSKVSGKDRDPVEVLHRVLDGDLAEFSGNNVRIDLENPNCVDKQSWLQDSLSYGIRTQYLRTTFHAFLDSKVELRTVPAPLLSGTAERPARVRRASTYGVVRAAFLNSGGSRGDPRAEARAADVLRAQDSVIVIRCMDDKKCDCKLYLWLTEADLAVLTHEHAKPVLECWLTQLEGPELRRAVEASAETMPSQAFRLKVEHNRPQEDHQDADAKYSIAPDLYSRPGAYDHKNFIEI